MKIFLTEVLAWVHRGDAFLIPATRRGMLDSASPGSTAHILRTLVTAAVAFGWLFAQTLSAQDFAVATTNNAIVITDLAGTNDVLTISEPVSGAIQFNAAGRTFSVDGGPLLTNDSGAITFTNGTTQITVDLAGGNDALTIDSFTAPLPSLTINGGTGDDTITINGNLMFATGASLDLDLQNDDTVPGTDSVIVNMFSLVSIPGNGSATIRCSRNVLVERFAQIATENGPLIVEANQQTIPTTGDFTGVLVEGYLSSFGAGALTVSGRGGTGPGANQHGVHVSGATAAIYGGANATNTVSGEAGATPGGFSYGVYVEGYDGESWAAMSGSGGQLLVQGTGTGAGLSQENVGVAIYYGAKIEMFDGGVLSISGNGGVGAGGGNRGVEVASFGSGNSTLSASGGSLVIYGTGGAGIDSDGVMVRDNSRLFATNGANINLLTDSLNLATNALIQAVTNDVSLSPMTAGVTVVMGGNDAAGRLGLGADELQRITARFLMIGSGGNVPIEIVNNVSLTNVVLLDLVTTAAITTASGGNTEVGVNSLQLTGQVLPGGTNAIGTLSATGNISLLAGSSVTFDVEIPAPLATNDMITTTGAVDILPGVNLNLALVGANTPLPGQSFTLVSRTGGAGTFVGLTEGAVITNLFGTGQDASITYMGGDGDDIVVTMGAGEIGISGPAGDLISGTNLVTFPSTFQTLSSALTLTITNSGNATLNLSSITPVAGNTGDFIPGTTGSFALAPGESAPLTINFVPTASGVRTAVIHIASDDPDENPFMVSVEGLGVDAPFLLTCPSNIVAYVTSGTNTTTAAWSDPTFVGTNTPTITCVPASGSVFPVGITPVVCTATNEIFTNSCTFFVVVQATNIIVVNTNDSGPGSLRQALADTAPGGTVVFAPELAGTTIGLTTGEIPLNRDVTVAGLGANQLRVSASLLSRIFNVGEARVTVSGLTLANGRSGPFSGGAIFNEGELVLLECELTNNVALGYGGAIGSGASANSLMVSNCTFSGNFAGRGGGAISAGAVLPVGPSIVIEQAGRASTYTNITINGNVRTWDVIAPGTPVTFSANYTANYTDGGGCPGCITQHYLGIDDVFSDCHDVSFGTSSGLISRSFTAPSTPGVYYISQIGMWWYSCYQFGTPASPKDPGVAVAVLIVDSATNVPANITVANSTFSGNAATLSGGALDMHAGAKLQLYNSTVVSNSAGTAGGISVVASDTEFVPQNSIIAGNVATNAPDINGPVLSGGFNLIGSTNGASGLLASDLTETNALLTPLQNNGGPTLTHLPLAGSAVVDAGTNALAPALDQRGLPRIVNGLIDIGSVEADFGVAPTITCSSNLVVSNALGQCGATVNFTVEATGSPAPVVTVSPPSGSFFPTGTNLVTCTASNATGVASCSFTIVVIDAEAPALTCPAPLVVAETSIGAGAATVFFAAPSVTDNCDTNPLVSFSPASGSLFPVGTTPVLCTVVDAAGNSNSCVFSVTVQAYTTATALSNPTLCPGNGTTLTTTPSGTGPFAFAWFKDSAPLAGETNATLSLTNVTTLDAASYCVVVTGTLNSVTNCGTLTINTNVSATPLTSVEVCPGTPVSFSTIATGTGPFAYSWFKDGSPLAGETNATFAITNTVNADGATYSVIVQGFCSAVTNSATLTVWTNTSATALTSLEVCPGTPVNFSTIASGTGPFAYSWFKDGSPITDATNALLELTNVVNGSEGVYSVVVQGLCTAVTNSASLTVWTNTAATVLTSLEVCPGTPISFSTIASGTGPFAYSWFKDGSPLAGETNATFAITNTVNADGAIYSVVVQGLCTAVTNSATLTVWTNTAATALMSLEVCPGTPVNFSTIASGTGPFAYSWFKDGSPLAGETNATFAITNTVNTDGATYSVVVQGICTAVTNSASLTVWTNTSATALTSLEVCPGTPVSFSTIASGTGPFAYSWFKDGSPIVDATNALLELTNIVNSSEGVYSVVVQGFCTAVTNSATLTVWTNTSATALTSLEVCPGTPVNFSTIASGTGPFTYSWFKDGSPLAGETNATFAISNTVNADGATYSVVVQGLCTAVTNSATLTVWTNTAATALTSLEVCPGTPAIFSTIASGTGPFAYSWFKDGSPILDATNALLELTNVVNGSEGVYSVIVQGFCTAVTNSASLTVWTNTAATALTSLEVCPGTPISFSTIASGTGPFAYSWLKDGSPLPGETNATFAITNTVNADGAIYSVVVQGLCTAVTNSASLTVWTNTSATALTSLEVCPGTPAIFSTIASGTGPFAYSWSKDGSPITDATNALLELTNVVNGSEGVYSVVVQGLCTAVTNSATLTVWTNTSATALTSLEVCPGTPISFSTIASGTGPFAYSWLKDGSPLPGETNATFAITNTVNADGATYSVVVQGLCTAVTNSALLTVWTNTFFGATPPVIAPPKSTAVITSPAQGTGPFTYQWFRDGSPIVGQTNDSLILTNVNLSLEGDFCVVAQGFCTTATNCVTFGILRDGVPPQVASAEILCAPNSAGLNRVMLVYNEEMYAPDATTIGNYSVSGNPITNITISPDGLVCILEFAQPFRCGFDYPLSVNSARDISGEILALTNINLSTLSLPCCNNTYALNLPAGYSLVANQLDWRFNNLLDKLPVMPEGAQVLMLKSTVVRTNATTEDGYPIDPEFDIYTFSSGAWNGNPILNPGSGFFVYTPSPTNITIRGSRPFEYLPAPFVPSIEAISRQVPDLSDFVQVYGTNPVEGIAIFRMVSTNSPVPMRPPTFQRHLFRGGVWEGGAPGAGIGEAWLAQRIEPAVITTNPVSQFGAPFGSTVTFSVAATGTAPLRYQWRLNGLTLPGQTNTTLTITNAQMINGGAYSVTVDSFFNTVESTPAYLTFPLPTLPLRNNFADLVVLSDPFANGYSSNVGANKEPGEPNHAGRPGGKSMWLGWQAPASGIVTFAITGSGFDTLLAAYRLVSGSLVEVVSDEESGGFLTSRIQFNAIAGETYYIAVDGFGGEEGPIALNWSLQPTSQVLPVVVAPPQSIVAGAGETVIFQVTAQGKALKYRWYFNNQRIRCEDDLVGTATFNSVDDDDDDDDDYDDCNQRRLKVRKIGPQHVGTYFVRIYSKDGLFVDSQPVALQINREGVDNRVRAVLTRDKLLDAVILPVPALASSLVDPTEFTDPADLNLHLTSVAASAGATVQRSYTGTQILNTFGSVKQPGEPNHCGIPGGASQWYLYEAPENGIASINTDGSTFDTVLAVYIGPGDSFTTLTNIACDNNSGTNGRTSAVSFPARAGVPYFVAVDGVNGATGVVYLNYSLLKPISLSRLSLNAQGSFVMEAQVSPEIPVFVQRSSGFSWVNIRTNISTNGFFQFTDTNAVKSTNLNYRLLQK